jgi:hypothetical protein
MVWCAEWKARVTSFRAACACACEYNPREEKRRGIDSTERKHNHTSHGNAIRRYSGFSSTPSLAQSPSIARPASAALRPP